MKAQMFSSTRVQQVTRHGINTAILSLALVVAGCGGGGGGSTVSGVTSSSPALQTPAAANAFTVTSDNYGIQSPTYLASTKSTLGIVMRAAIASSMTDPGFKTVSRIDIPPSAALSTGTVYSLGAATGGSPAFPGSIYFLNGHPSTLLRTVDGSISFSSFGSNSGDRISGSFSAIIEDGGDSATPKARYTVAANFDFVTDSFGSVPGAGPAALASTGYDVNCASCHALGSHDTTSAGAGDLALKGGKLNALYSADQPGHQGIRLAASEISALQVLLNSN
jgi:hypothetical protein